MDLETSVIRVLKIIKMANIIDIPSKSYQTYFGEVKKCVWFEVTDNYNYFSVILNVQRLQNNNVNLQIGNLGSSSTIDSLWSKIYQVSSNPQTVQENLKISHVPQQNSTVYAVFNK
jgi:hypothetical protein